MAAHDFPVGAPPSGPLSAVDAVRVFRSACLSRALDRTSRAMQRAGQGYYTIGSSGHEGLAALALALRPTDMAFLHYRDAAFQIARATQVPGQSIAWDMLLSFATSSDDPISGGRHKVLGSKALCIPPQTSTIASHLPKAVGAAYSIGAARRRRPEHRVLDDHAIVGAPSATHPPITRRRRVRSTPHAGLRFSCRRCRCSSSARTMASASRPRRRAAGFVHRSKTGRGWPITRPTGWTFMKRSLPQAKLSNSYAGGTGQRSYVYEPFVCMVTPVRTCRPSTCPRPMSRRKRRTIRFSIWRASSHTPASSRQRSRLGDLPRDGRTSDPHRRKGS